MMDMPPVASIGYGLSPLSSMFIFFVHGMASDAAAFNERVFQSLIPDVRNSPEVRGRAGGSSYSADQRLDMRADGRDNWRSE